MAVVCRRESERLYKCEKCKKWGCWDHLDVDLNGESVIYHHQNCNPNDGLTYRHLSEFIFFVNKATINGSTNGIE